MIEQAPQNTPWWQNMPLLGVAIGTLAIAVNRFRSSMSRKNGGAAVTLNEAVRAAIREIVKEELTELRREEREAQLADEVAELRKMIEERGGAR